MGRWNRKKDVTLMMASRSRQTKNSDLASKIVPDYLPGQVERRMVKCGKQGCKCSRGELHGPYFYHRTWSGNSHQRHYIRLENVSKVTKACENYRQMQVTLRLGRWQHQRDLIKIRHLLRMLSL